MCEIFGLSANLKMHMNELLGEFFSHSTEHPDGWGMALFHRYGVNIEKEPIPAYKSQYLKVRLRQNISTNNMLAHIRLATKGTQIYENCHPFVYRDKSGRSWTLIHNGTIFHSPVLGKYLYQQEGHTDSERILLYFIDCLNAKIDEKGDSLKKKERFQILEDAIANIAERNKLNLLIFDGEVLYSHSNFKGSLHKKSFDEGVVIATSPLTISGWEPVAFNTLEAYKDGVLLFQGEDHGHEYIFCEEDAKYLHLDYANL